MKHKMMNVDVHKVYKNNNKYTQGKFNDFWNHICGDKNMIHTLLAFQLAYFDDQSVLPWMAGLFEDVRLL